MDLGIRASGRKDGILMKFEGYSNTGQASEQTKWFIDTDSHVTEPRDVWSSRVPRRYADQMPRLMRSDEGKDVWVIGDAVVSTTGNNATAGWEGFPESYPPTLEDCLPASYDSKARLAYMDGNGIWAQALYPNVG